MQQGLLGFLTLLFLFMTLVSKGNLNMVLVGFILISIGIVILPVMKEDYIPPYFPWNEATLVHKKIPNSTVYECSWKGCEYTFPRKEPVFYDAQQEKA